jgi:branched-chain amino acid transport system permease protein
LLLWRICESPFGRTLRAIRDDEIAASALGKNIYRFKVLAFVLSGAFASVPGALFASYMRYIDPTSFTLMETVFILSAVLIGGAGNIKGPIIGTVFVILLPEFLRFLHIPDTIAPNVRQILYGLFILILMRLRPQGLGGEYKLQ